MKPGIFYIYSALLSACFFFYASNAAGSDWQVRYDKSHIRFSALQEGSTIEGSFKQFQALIRFDPEQLATSRFQVWINTASVNTESPERDDILRSEDFFHSLHWPQAHFQTLAITALSDSRYLAESRLTIRDVTRTVAFPFTLEINNNLLIGRGELVIDRFDYDMAQGDWQDTEVVGAKIHIQVTIEANHKILTEEPQNDDE